MDPDGAHIYLFYKGHRPKKVLNTKKGLQQMQL